MIRQSTLNCPPGQMMALNRYRTSILRPHELVEIRGSYWPRILVLSESAEKRRKSYNKSPTVAKTSMSPIKVSRKLKRKEMIRQLKKISPTPSPLHRPASPSFEASPDALSLGISAVDQNSGPCWKPSTHKESKIKTSSFTGRPLVPQQDNATISTAQSSSGLKGPRRRKPLKAMVAPR